MPENGPFEASVTTKNDGATPENFDAMPDRLSVYIVFWHSVLRPAAAKRVSISKALISEKRIRGPRR
jgi:hypothetical protein